MHSQVSDNPHPPTINALDFDAQVLHAEVPVLIQVSSAFCPPCRAAEPVIARIAAEQRARLKVVKVDASEAPDLVARLGARGVPTFLLFVAGQERGRQAGFRSAQQLERWVVQNL